jgi:hypothetical protein
MNNINLFFPDDLILNQSYQYRAVVNEEDWIEVVYMGRDDFYYMFSFKNHFYMNIRLTHYAVSKDIREIKSYIKIITSSHTSQHFF